MDSRSNTISRYRSLSYPARACDRNARYFPFGEYTGPSSLPGLCEAFTGLAPGVSSRSVNTSLFVLAAGTRSTLVTNAISYESGARAYPTGPFSENGGASASPISSRGVRSRTAFPSVADTTST